jgi:hypothetical protein
MAVCEKAEKAYANAELIICIDASDHYAEIRSTNIPFRLLTPLLDEYNKDGSEMETIELIASIADTINAGRIIIERDENEIVAVFYSKEWGVGG